ncbi:MAG: HD domain-containing protein [Treponema sp.]|nr:HD domain-containing protein [Treponema sp.]
METISTNNLKEDLSFPGDLLIDSNFLLLPKTAPVTKELMDALKEWEFDTVLCDGSIAVGMNGTASNSADDKEKENAHKMGASIKKVIETSKRGFGNSDQARMKMVQRVYDEYMHYIESVFTHYATHKTIDQEELSETVQELCVFIKENKSYMLRVNPTVKKDDKNFLVTHSMRTTVIAIAIALQLHMPLSKMIELGMTCIIHEIGMLRLPPQIYLTDRKLTPGERLQIYKHPLLGYSIVKELDFPLTIQLGVLEHHEDENGTGYPRRLSSEKISTAAKIIYVACSFEAITSARTYKEGRSPFEAILEILQNRDHKYDDAIIKALLYTVSLYPLGSYVYLSNKKPALVVDTNPDNPKCPIVQLLTEHEKDGSPKRIQTGENGIAIARILSNSEQEDLLKILSEQQENQKETAAAGANDTTKENDSDSQNINNENTQNEPLSSETESSAQAQNDSMNIETGMGNPFDSEKTGDAVTVDAEKKEAPAHNTEATVNSDGTEEIDISFFN